MKKSIFKKALAVLSALTIVSSMAITASAAGENVNLATGATAFIDPVVNAGGQSFLNDGDLSTGAYAIAATPITHFGVDFGAAKQVNSVTVYVASTKSDGTGESRIQKAKLQYSNDGASWTDIEGTDSQLNTTLSESNNAGKYLYKTVFTFDTVNAQYIRLYSIEAPSAAQVFEFEAYYITSDTIKAEVSNAGGRSDTEGAKATGFLAKVTNSGAEEATFNSMDLAVTSTETTKYFNNNKFMNMTLGAGASVYYGIVVEDIDDGAATATAFVK